MRCADLAACRVHSVAGYYKGLLHKAGATEDAKAHAREILDKMGVQYEE